MLEGMVQQQNQGNNSRLNASTQNLMQNDSSHLCLKKMVLNIAN
jgi:hypothetical protein